MWRWLGSLNPFLNTLQPTYKQHNAAVPVCMLRWAEIVTRLAMYVWRNIEERSCNHCCSGKAISTSTSYSECVSVAICIRQYYIFWMRVCSLSYPTYNTHAPYYIVVCGLSSLPYFSTLSHKRYDFRGKKLLNMRRVCLIFCATYV